jgi:uroporphyrinogen-III synthase
MSWVESSSRLSAAASQDTTLTLHVVAVALTREDGKNDKLRDQLVSHPRLTDRITVTELPCIAHADGEDYDQLRPTLEMGDWDYIAVTSPEAARVLASAWITKEHGPAVAAVGKATQEALEECGINVAFCPSKATAETLAVELPLVPDKEQRGLPTTILYPASSKAKATLEKGLTARGFAVTRLDTYDTVTAQWSDAQKEDAAHVQVACFASPSAVKGWLKNSSQNRQVLAACIGEASAQACRENEWPESQIFYPDKPGVAGWADAVADALESLSKVHS